MTVPLRGDSPRRATARLFGDELRKAMRARRVGAGRVALACGVTTSSLANWRAGDNVPRIDTAIRLAEALDWPRLVGIARQARRGTCARCGREWFNEGGSPKRYCSGVCRDIDAQLRRPVPGAALATAVRAELARKAGKPGGASKVVLADALATYVRSEARRVARIDEQGRALAAARDAISAMCSACEPEGRCRDEACPLRPASPLPLALGGPVVVPATRAPGVWGEGNRERHLALVRRANADRWARPGERERIAAMTRARFAAMTPEQRADHGKKVSEARRRKAGAA